MLYLRCAWRLPSYKCISRIWSIYPWFLFSSWNCPNSMVTISSLVSSLWSIHLTCVLWSTAPFLRFLNHFDRCQLRRWWRNPFKTVISLLNTSLQWLVGWKCAKISSFYSSFVIEIAPFFVSIIPVATNIKISQFKQWTIIFQDLLEMKISKIKQNTFCGPISNNKISLFVYPNCL